MYLSDGNAHHNKMQLAWITVNRNKNLTGNIITAITFFMS